MCQSKNEDIGLLCPDKSWIPWNELSNTIFGRGNHGLTGEAVSDMQFTISAGEYENKLLLHSLGVNGDFLPLPCCHTSCMVVVHGHKCCRDDCCVKCPLSSLINFPIDAVLVVSNAHDDSITILEEGDVSVRSWLLAGVSSLSIPSTMHPNLCCFLDGFEAQCVPHRSLKLIMVKTCA